jgi:hypothetical protein
VTEECLLDPSRNPQLGKEGIEKLLKEYLGIDKVIWLWKGMAGESSKQQPVLFLNGLAGGGGGAGGHAIDWARFQPQVMWGRGGGASISATSTIAVAYANQSCFCRHSAVTALC